MENQLSAEQLSVRLECINLLLDWKGAAVSSDELAETIDLNAADCVCINFVVELRFKALTRTFIICHQCSLHQCSFLPLNLIIHIQVDSTIMTFIGAN
jgi:hypothetical protein